MTYAYDTANREPDAMLRDGRYVYHKSSQDYRYDTGLLKGDAYVRRWGLDAGLKAALKHAPSWDRETGAGFVDAVLRIAQAVLA